MIDRPRALVAGGLVVVVVAVVFGVGFVVGSAGDGDSERAERSEDLSAGPTGMQDGVPVGFAHDIDGARAAALSWIPWLYSSPAAERPDGIDAVLAAGVDVPGEDATGRLASVRLQFAPVAVQVEMDTDDRATLTLLGSALSGSPGEPLGGEILLLPVALEWDHGVDDWRITELPDGEWSDYTVGDGLDASEIQGFEVVRPAGAVEGSAIVEEVPGE